MKTLADIRPLAAQGNVIPIYKEFLPDLETPITALLKLKEGGKRPFLLESVEVGEKVARFSFLGRDPLYTFKAKGSRVEIRGKQEKEFDGKPLEELQKFLARFRGVDDPDLPAFSGGAVGFFAYDAVRLLEDSVPEAGRDDYGLPDLDFGLYEAFVVFDHLKHRLSIVANVMPDEFGGLEPAYARAVSLLDALEAELRAPLAQGDLLESPSVPALSAPAQLDWKSNVTREQFLGGVERCKEFIRAGDAFQIVLSQRFAAKTPADGVSIYRRLRAINPSPYMFYLDFKGYGDFEVVGASPETLVKVQDGLCETKPIAGTRPRGKDEAEDKALAAELLADPKEKAEHLMLVDLGRNDIGRVAAYGSVNVSQFMEIEPLSHVMHIVSVVKGKLRDDKHALDALMSCLPAGTLSGAPKIRAMQIIDSLEPTRRGIYGGAVCYLDFRGNLDSCIAIRTLMLKGGTAYVQAGAGLVADSVAETEYEETRHKARAAMLAVEVASFAGMAVGNGGKKS
ncbi:MAG TPA: anthranilate synthase component I [Fibrobacteria bacterium]|nr:anthranilate synthase component I [Fibrobacteria bacterium]